MRILTHVCCGPCFTAVHEILAGSGHVPTVLYFNPNIHPWAEYRRRQAYLDKFCRNKAVPMIIGDYEIRKYFDLVYGFWDKRDRCRRCYRLRLGRTAAIAAQNGFDAFTTSLLLSPHQFHEELKDIAKEMSHEFDIEFLYQDFRPAYRRSVELSRELEMYRQKYCGCVFSDSERIKPESSIPLGVPGTAAGRINQEC